MQDVAPFGEVAVVTTSTPTAVAHGQGGGGGEEDACSSIAEELALDALATLVHEEMMSSSGTGAAGGYGDAGGGSRPASARGAVSE